MTSPNKFSISYLELYALVSEKSDSWNRQETKISNKYMFHLNPHAITDI